MLVEVQNAMPYYKTGFATFPDIIAQIAKESGDSGVSEIDARAFQVCPQLIPGIRAWTEITFHGIYRIMSRDTTSICGRPLRNTVSLTNGRD